jgi:hypothetical protein
MVFGVHIALSYQSVQEKDGRIDGVTTDPRVGRLGGRIDHSDALYFCRGLLRQSMPRSRCKHRRGNEEVTSPHPITPST